MSEDKGNISFGKDYIVISLEGFKVRLSPMTDGDENKYIQFREVLQNKSGDRTDGYMEREIQKRQGEQHCDTCED